MKLRAKQKQKQKNTMGNILTFEVVILPYAKKQLNKLGPQLKKRALQKINLIRQLSLEELYVHSCISIISEYSLKKYTPNKIKDIDKYVWFRFKIGGTLRIYFRLRKGTNELEIFAICPRGELHKHLRKF